MDEKKEAERKRIEEEQTKAKETTGKDFGNGLPSEEEEAIVVKAKAIAMEAKATEELKAENLEKEEKLLARKEALAALGGGSPAGDKPTKTEETPKEYADKVMANSL